MRRINSENKRISAIYILIGVILLFALLGVGLWICRSFSRGYISQKAVSQDPLPEESVSDQAVSDLYGFVSRDGSRRGKGFFVKFSSRERIFIYHLGSQDPNPALSTMNRKFQALMKSGSSYKITKREVRQEILTLSFDEARMGHRRHSEEDSRILFQSAQERGRLATIDMVPFDGIEFGEFEVVIHSKDIMSVSNVMMTTGGSVYVFKIDQKSGDSLILALGTKEDRDEIEAYASHIRSNLDRSFTLVSRNPEFQAAMYVTNSSGWGGQVYPDVHRNVATDTKLMEPKVDVWKGWVQSIRRTDIKFE